MPGTEERRLRKPVEGGALLALATCLAAGGAAAADLQGRLDCGERCGDFVVHVEGVAGSYSGTGRVVELGQRDKRFIPHVLPLLAGATLRIGNDDPFMHNVHARRDGRTVFNVNLIFQYQTLDQVIAEPGVYALSCEPHPEMSAFLVVLDHPFFAQPDAGGEFRIEDLPPGSYTVVAYDADRDRSRRRRVVVGEGGARVEF